jgi:rRNA pseudouridine-1189 N-methylase Emg1 (Nep1/Mra1 family)
MSDPEIRIISSKKLQTIQPALLIIIDGAHLIVHPTKPRLLASTDSSAISQLAADRRFDVSTLNAESMHNTLLYLQGTALNLSGVQRVFIRTADSPSKLIAVDPRFETPLAFSDFARMMYCLVKDQLVSGAGGERLMKFVKSDVSNSIPPGIPRCAIHIHPNDNIVDPADFVSQNPLLIYVNLNPRVECTDEVIERRACLSNDALSCGMTAARVVRAVEKAHAIW